MSETVVAPRVLIMGVGNILLRDEGFGVAAVNHLEKNYYWPENVRLQEGATQGLLLMSELEECDLLVVLDVVLGGKEPGTVYLLENEDLSSSLSFQGSMHQTDRSRPCRSASWRGAVRNAWPSASSLLTGAPCRWAFRPRPRPCCRSLRKRWWPNWPGAASWPAGKKRPEWYIRDKAPSSRLSLPAASFVATAMVCGGHAVAASAGGAPLLPVLPSHPPRVLSAGARPRHDRGIARTVVAARRRKSLPPRQPCFCCERFVRKRQRMKKAP